MTTSPVVEALELRIALEQRDREIDRLKSELTKSNATLADLNDKVKTTNLEYHVGTAARRLGIIEDAVPDIISRAKRSGEWDLDSAGKLRVKDEHGFFADTAYEWVQAVKAEVPTYFTDGVQAEDKPAADAEPKQAVWVMATEAELLRIFDPKTMNLTRATEIYRRDPALATRIARQVGNRIFETL